MHHIPRLHTHRLPPREAVRPRMWALLCVPAWWPVPLVASHGLAKAGPGLPSVIEAPLAPASPPPSPWRSVSCVLRSTAARPRARPHVRATSPAGDSWRDAVPRPYTRGILLSEQTRWLSHLQLSITSPLKYDRFISHEPNHLRLVRDQEISQAQISLKPPEQAQYLGLHRYIES